MKKFNLTEYLKNPSRKVVTRDGREVRIICTDAKNDEPIIALIYNNNRKEENVYTYNKDGYFYKNNDSCLDLFFAPIKKEGWVNIYKNDYNYFMGSNYHIYKTKQEAFKVKEGYDYKSNGFEYIDTIKIEWEE